MEAIRDSAVYTKKSKSGHLVGLYYQVSWKRYLEEKNAWESASVVQHLRKLINLFYKDYSDKSTVTSLALDIALALARLIVKPIEPLKQKRGQPITSINKQAKKN